MACMVLGEKMKPGDSSVVPAVMGDDSCVVAVVGGAGAARRWPSVSRRGSPPPSSAVAGEIVGKDEDDDVVVVAGGLPVSRCTTVMNSCGLAWMTLGVCSYTITGFLVVVVDAVGGAGEEPRDDDDEDDTFSGSGRGPRRPVAGAARLEGDDDASEEGMAATVMVMAAAPSFSTNWRCVRTCFARSAGDVCSTEYGAVQGNARARRLYRERESHARQVAVAMCDSVRL